MAGSIFMRLVYHLLICGFQPCANRSGWVVTVKCGCQIDQNINLLWPILSALTGEPLVALPYAERLPRLLAHGFGLWDVLGACEREGSLDSAIRKPAANDFARLRELCPLLETVGFNGQTSGKFAPQFAAEGYRTVVLPSTSPAYASLTLAEKLVRWSVLL